MSEGGPSRNSGEPPQRADLAVEVVRHGGTWDGSAISDATVKLAALAAFAEAPPPDPAVYEATVVLTDDTEMRDLNRNWRGKDQPTNVLSFPAGETPGEPGALGDIVIAYETAITCKTTTPSGWKIWKERPSPRLASPTPTDTGMRPALRR
jgi:probable rRNA maturation factor